MTFADAKAAKESYLAHLRRLEYEEKAGRVVDMDFALTQLEFALATVAAVLRNAPGKYAPRLVGCDSIAQGQTLLEAVMDEALRELSEQGERIASALPSRDAPASARDLAA